MNRRIVFASTVLLLSSCGEPTSMIAMRSAEDPIDWVRAREAELAPLCTDFWTPWLEESGSTAAAGGGINMPDVHHPEVLHMMEGCWQLLVPYVVAELPSIDPAVARAYFLDESLSHHWGSAHAEVFARWHEVRSFSKTESDELVEIEMGNKMGAGQAWSAVTLHLRRSEGDWKICAWPRWSSDRHLPSAQQARPYLPDVGALDVNVSSTAEGMKMRVGFDRELQAPDASSLATEFAQWRRSQLPEGFRWESISRRHPELAPSPALALWADADVPQETLALVLQLFEDDACPKTEMRLQAVAGATTLPVEYVFDQSVTRPNGDATGATAVALHLGESVQQLCARVDRMIAEGATRLYLVPPE